MPSVRISSDQRHADVMEWIGVADIDKQNRIARTLPIPEEVYELIEAKIRSGHLEGDVFDDKRSRFHWFLDR